jgi:hypothetical protein
MNSVDREKKYYQMAKDAFDSEFGEMIARSADIINSKISALLTHISFMIAIVAILGIYFEIPELIDPSKMSSA